MIKRIIYIGVLILMISSKMMAQGGMWIPLFLGELNEAEMKKMGMEISAEDIYSINQSSLKDAIVIFGNGCTGELISQQGLVLTNHHCGYGSIQAHSSIEHDYLTDGFWAQNFEEELPNPGLSVTFLKEMREVTREVLANVGDNMSETDRAAAIKKNLKALKERHAMDNGVEVLIKPFFSGNRYFMFFYERFRDIRLVGAPPSNIGKFGGDTDNWMWPRHTGDFSLFRIYASPDNRPAAYSKDNVPYTPKRSLKISLQGVEKGDFTFVYGYPGRTQEYLVSDAVKLITEVENPIKIKLRTLRLNTMKAAQNQDAKVRIQYAKKVASLANGWKKWQGENRGIKRLRTIANKQQLEQEMGAWLATQPAMQQKYGNILSDYKRIYQALTPLRRQFYYYYEAGMGIELVKWAASFGTLLEKAEAYKDKPEAMKDIKADYAKRMQAFFKDYYEPIDRKVAVSLLAEYTQHVDKAELPMALQPLADASEARLQAYVDKLFDDSMFDKPQQLEAVLTMAPKKLIKSLAKDPAYQLAVSLQARAKQLRTSMRPLSAELRGLDRKYMQMQMDYQPNKRFFPDANFTMRVTYGKVDDYKPRDGVSYNYFTTLQGIMEKENPDIYDYAVEEKLKSLYRNKDYGQYADKDGSMHVCFIGTNHTTGGNSGSPVFNAKGHLVGLNFDRNWEGTMSDINYDPSQCRNIILDIRYCLFVIDKYAGATRLIEEMQIVND